MKYAIIGLVLVLTLLMAASVAAEEGTKAEAVDSTKIRIMVRPDSCKSDRVTVYYLHSNRRCMTCKKLEAYAEEAVKAGFAEQLKDSTVLWQVVNFEQEGNEHFVKEYELFTQSLILSRVCDQKELAWKNLDKIWKLVGNKDEYLTYVDTELKTFLSPAAIPADTSVTK